MRTKRTLVPLFLAVVCTAAAYASPAYSKPTVYFAGFALRGSAAEITARFPYTSQLLTEKTASGIDPINAEIRSKLLGQKTNAFKLDMRGLGDIAENQSIAAAFTLNRESIGQGRIGDTYKLYIQLSGAVLFFNYKDMTVIANYPVSIEYIDVFDKPPSQTEIYKDVAALYLGDMKLNLISNYVDALAKATLKRKEGNHLRITRVTIAGSAMTDLAPALRNQPSEAREFIAETFGQALSSNDNVALLPYVKDAAIGNKMALRFANGDVFNLTVPETDYAISIHLTKFVKIAVKKQSFATTWIYGAYITLKIFEPLSEKIYLNEHFRDGVVKITPSNQTEVMDWPVYQEALLKLFGNVTRSFLEPNSSWARQSSGSATIRAQLKNTLKVLQSCR